MAGRSGQCKTPNSDAIFQVSRVIRTHPSPKGQRGDTACASRSNTKKAVSVRTREVHARIVVLQNLAGAVSPKSHLLHSPLAHAHSVTETTAFDELKLFTNIPNLKAGAANLSTAQRQAKVLSNHVIVPAA